MKIWINFLLTEWRPKLDMKSKIPQVDSLLGCILPKFHSPVLLSEKTMLKDKQEGLSKQVFGISSDADSELPAFTPMLQGAAVICKVSRAGESSYFSKL